MHNKAQNPLTAGLNLVRLEEIAAWLEAGAPHRADPNQPDNEDAIVSAFNMADFGCTHDHDQGCGTACCIAGTANAFHFIRTAQPWDGDSLNNPALAIGLLGLTEDQAEALFYPFAWDGETGSREAIGDTNWSRISPEHAARVIRHLMATGEVNWNLPEAA